MNLQRQEQLGRDTTFQKKEIEVQTAQNIHDGDQKIQITEHQAEVFAQEQIIEKQKEEANTEKYINEAKLDAALIKKRLQMQAEREKYENQLAMAKEAEQRKLKQV